MNNCPHCQQSIDLKATAPRDVQSWVFDYVMQKIGQMPNNADYIIQGVTTGGMGSKAGLMISVEHPHSDQRFTVEIKIKARTA